MRYLQREQYTVGQLTRIYEFFNWSCGICGIRESEKLYSSSFLLHVDHDHETQKVRGLLCVACNVRFAVDLLQKRELTWKEEFYLQKAAEFDSQTYHKMPLAVSIDYDAIQRKQRPSRKVTIRHEK